MVRNIAAIHICHQLLSHIGLDSITNSRTLLCYLLVHSNYSVLRALGRTVRRSTAGLSSVLNRSLGCQLGLLYLQQ